MDMEIVPEAVEGSPVDVESIGSSDDDEDMDFLDELLEEGLREPKEGGMANGNNAINGQENDEDIDECPSKKRKIDLRDGLARRLPQHEVKTKIVMIKRQEKDHFDVLPEGWIEVIHQSGYPLFFHRASRVVTMAKPYFLGAGSLRRHRVPVSAIPCLQYRRQLDREESMKESSVPNSDIQVEQQNGEVGVEEVSNNNVQNATSICLESTSTVPTTTTTTTTTTDTASATISSTNSDIKTTTEDIIDQPTPNGIPKLNVKVSSVVDSNRDNSLDPIQIRAYCSKLFKFAEIHSTKFKKWSERRAYHKQMKLRDRPSLPDGTLLITCPVLAKGLGGGSGGGVPRGPDGEGDKGTSNPRPSRKDFVINPAGKSSVCILHEFIQHSQHVQPQYEFKELENTQTPYSATVVINRVRYGVGFGSSKRAAKSKAATKTLELLIPEYTNQLKNDTLSGTTSDTKDNESNRTDQEDNLKFFEEIDMMDDRVPHLCQTAGQFSPYQILVECLKRNNGIGVTDITFTVDQTKTQKLKNLATMKAGDLESQVWCRNKQEGKQKASQEILAKLYPQFKSWGSLLKLYGRGSYKTPRERKVEEQKITELQQQAVPNRPNYAILNKLQSLAMKHALETKNNQNSVLRPNLGTMCLYKERITVPPPTPDMYSDLIPTTSHCGGDVDAGEEDISDPLHTPLLGGDSADAFNISFEEDITADGVPRTPTLESNDLLSDENAMDQFDDE